MANYRTATEQYSDMFQLGLRMIQVASGVTVGLFVAQIFVYALGRLALSAQSSTRASMSN